MKKKTLNNLKFPLNNFKPPIPTIPLTPPKSSENLGITLRWLVYVMLETVLL